jgi:predicted DCC family thiol-disulfide oxidoreductase YuxK
VRWIRALDRAHRVRVVPYQKPSVPISVGLSVEQCEEAVWAVEPGDAFGRPWCRYRGAAAINTSLAVALGVRLPLVFYGLPGVSRLQERLYDLVAANRHRVPGDVPYCKARPEECS